MCPWTMKQPAEECGRRLPGKRSKRSREDLVRLITTIYRQKQRLTGRGRKLHSADEQIFREAEKLLYDEISVVLGMEEKQVQPYIAKRLKEKEKNA